MGKLPYVLAELKSILMSPIKTPKDRKPETELIGKPSFSEEDEDNLDTVQDENKENISDTPIENVQNQEKNETETKNEDKTETEEDLPSEIVRVMGKACTQILVTQPDEECCLTYLGLLERVLTHEAFSQNDKRRMQSWKAQCQKLARSLAMNRKLGSIEKGPKKYALS